VKEERKSEVPVASIPKPPAFETAATNGGVEIQLIPGNNIGYCILKSFVILVSILLIFSQLFLQQEAFLSNSFNY
jgi:hypothetical protein